MENMGKRKFKFCLQLELLRVITACSMDRLHPSVTAAAQAVKQYLQDETPPITTTPVQIWWIVNRDALPPWLILHWPEIHLQTHAFYDTPSIKVFAVWRQKRFLLALMRPANINKSFQHVNEED